MTRQQVAVLTRLVDQAHGTDMDIGMSVNVLAALLTERAALVEALTTIRNAYRDPGDEATWPTAGEIDAAWKAVDAALAQAGVE